jgi:hypothetical protein
MALPIETSEILLLRVPPASETRVKTSGTKFAAPSQISVKPNIKAAGFGSDAASTKPVAASSAPAVMV